MSDASSTDQPIAYCCHEYHSVRYRILDFLGMPNYRVGTDGSIWTHNQKGGAKQWKVGPWRLMKTGADRTGHLNVKLRKDGGYVRYEVSNLVLLAFVGPRPEDTEACHFPDQNPANNHVENLRWGTRVENQSHRVLNGTDQCGERHSQAKLTWESVEAIRRLRNEGWTLQRLADRFGVKIMCISQVVNHKTWTRKEGTYVEHI